MHMYTLIMFTPRLRQHHGVGSGGGGYCKDRRVGRIAAKQNKTKKPNTQAEEKTTVLYELTATMAASVN